MTAALVEILGDTGRGGLAPACRHYRMRSLKLQLLLVTGLFLYIFVAGLVIRDLALGRGGQLSAEDQFLADYLGLAGTSNGRESFFARLTTERRRQMAANIHFVSQIIAKTGLPDSEAKRLARVIVVESSAAGMDPLLVTAVVKHESTFRKNARSGKGALGLMQLMPATARYVSDREKLDWRGVSRLTDPHYNVRLGISYLKELAAQYRGNLEHALIAYNWGPTNLGKAFRSEARIPEVSKRYARGILNHFAGWQREFDQRRAEFQYLDPDRYA